MDPNNPVWPNLSSSAPINPSVHSSPPPQSPLNPPPQVSPLNPSIGSTPPPPPASPSPVVSSPLNPPPTPPFQKSKLNKKVVALGLLLILAVALPLTVFVSRQPQTIEQEAAEEQITPETVIFEIDGEPFSLQSIIDVAKEQYSEAEAKGNKEVWKIARDILIEREILDKWAEENTKPTDDEVSSLEEATGLSRDEAFYELLREKVVFSEVKYIKAISIGFWVPPEGQRNEYEAADRNKISQQFEDGAPAMDQASVGLNSGQDPVTIAERIIGRYPSLSDVMAVNGYIVSSLAEEDKITAGEPALYQYGDSNFDVATREKLFAQNVVPVRVIKIDPTPASGGISVFKVIEKKNTGEESYSSWLKNKKDSLIEEKIVL